MRWTMLALFAALAGCATVAHGAPWITMANADAAFAPNPAARRWQAFGDAFPYRRPERTATLQCLASEGWSIVGLNNWMICFQRPAP